MINGSRSSQNLRLPFKIISLIKGMNCLYEKNYSNAFVFYVDSFIRLRRG